MFSTGTDSVSGGDVSLKEVEIWAARQTSLLFGTLAGNGVYHNVDFVLSEVERSILDVSLLTLFTVFTFLLVDDTGVGHDNKDSSNVTVVGVWFAEHVGGGIHTFGDKVTMAHVVSRSDSIDERFLVVD
jgi:hypothetical protein